MPINYTQRDPNAFYKGAEFERENRLTQLAMQNQQQDRATAAEDRQRRITREDMNSQRETQDRDREKALRYIPFAQSALQSPDPRQFIASALASPLGDILRADGVFDDEDLEDPELPQTLQAFIGFAGPQNEAPKIGAFQPGDYTPESFARFQQTGNTADLKRYQAPQAGYTLSPGQTRFGPDNKPQASSAPKPDQPAGPAKLPIGALRLVDDAKQAIGSVAQSKTMIDTAINTLNSGVVDLGLVSNAAARARNYAGKSNESSRAYASIRQTFEKLRNNYLLLAKGVQTEGDAKRAWDSEIGESVQNDNRLAMQQLEKAERMMQQMQAMQEDRIATVYSNYGAEPSQAAPSAPSGGWTIKRIK